MINTNDKNSHKICGTCVHWTNPKLNPWVYYRGLCVANNDKHLTDKIDRCEKWDYRR